MEQTVIRINSFSELEPDTMSYYKSAEDNNWYLYLPGCGLGNLANHQVIEHEDGTISVTPSILVDGYENGTKTQKHGYITKSIWSDC